MLNSNTVFFLWKIQYYLLINFLTSLQHWWPISLFLYQFSSHFEIFLFSISFHSGHFLELSKSERKNSFPKTSPGCYFLTFPTSVNLLTQLPKSMFRWFSTNGCWIHFSHTFLHPVEHFFVYKLSLYNWDDCSEYSYISILAVAAVVETRCLNCLYTRNFDQFII